MPWAQRKEKKSASSLSGAGCFLEAAPSPPDTLPAFQPPKTRCDLLTNLPSCTFKQRDPRLLLAGQRLPQSRDGLTGQEHQLNAVKIALSTC